MAAVDVAARRVETTPPTVASMEGGFYYLDTTLKK